MWGEIGIMFFGALAIYLVGKKNSKYQKWGYVLGLMGQPFWFWVTIENEQWGILIMTIFYTYSWVNGIYNHWFKKEKEFPFEKPIDSISKN